MGGQSLIIKSHRLYNYMRLPVGIPRPGVIAFMCISAFAGGLILSDVCTAISQPHYLPHTTKLTSVRWQKEERNLEWNQLNITRLINLLELMNSSKNPIK